MGGLSKQTLIADAKKDLLKNLKDGELQDGQALVNITVNWKRTMYTPILVKVTCTITADIVEFK